MCRRMKRTQPKIRHLEGGEAGGGNGVEISIRRRGLTEEQKWTKADE